MQPYQPLYLTIAYKTFVLRKNPIQIVFTNNLSYNIIKIKNANERDDRK